MRFPIAKNSAAATLGALGGRSGRGKSKRRGDASYYRDLVARRKDRQGTAVSLDRTVHRHLNHSDYTLAAIDDVIGRGRLAAWTALRDALGAQPELREKVLRICAAHLDDPYAQRYHFWDHYARHAQGPQAAS